MRRNLQATTWFAVATAALTLSFASPATVRAQYRDTFMKHRDTVIFGEVSESSDSDSDSEPDDSPYDDLTESEKLEAKFPGSAPLNTDSEQEFLASLAKKYADDGQLAQALALWQRVLDQSGDTLVTDDGRFYVSLSAKIEGHLGKLTTAQLRVYRVAADGEARAAMARNEDRRVALSEVSRRYFLSSLGDDATYELACIALDEHDFATAGRLLDRILTEHPDPSIRKQDILVRLAVANVRLRDMEAAKKNLEELKSLGGVTSRLVREVEAYLENGAGAAPSIASSDWNMAMGGSSRHGHMPDLPAETFADNALTAVWQLNYAGDDDELRNNQQQLQQQRFRGRLGGEIGYGRGGYDYAVPDSTVYLKRSKSFGYPVLPGNSVSQPVTQTISQWQSHYRRPATQMVFLGDQIFVKSHFDAASFRRSGVGADIAWRTAWVNKYQVDDWAATMFNNGLLPQLEKNVNSPSDYFWYADRVHSSMSVIDGVLYCIEGERSYRGQDTPQPERQQINYQYGVVPQRGRKNFLAAYDAKTGKASWHVNFGSAEDPESAMGIVAPPVACGPYLLVPLVDAGTVHLAAINPEDGKVAWKTHLCDEPIGGSNSRSPVCIAVAGQQAYVLCGMGVVFSVDGLGGSIQWAIRYERSTGDDQMGRNYGFPAGSLLKLEGWEQDVIIPHGRALICLPSDHDGIFAMDSRTGEILWKSPRQSPFDTIAEYCLGVNETGVVVAGDNVVRCYALNTGKVAWETTVKTAGGRGAVLASEVLLPGRGELIRLDAKDGKEISRCKVEMPNNLPIGNLYSDGTTLWALGPGVVSILSSTAQQIEMLAKLATEGDLAAMVRQSELLISIDKQDDADKVLRDWLDATAKAGDIKNLLSGLHLAENTLQWVHQNSALVLEQLIVAANANPDDAAQVEPMMMQCLLRVGEDGSKVSVATLLKVAPMLTSKPQRMLLWNIARESAAVAKADEVATLLASKSATDQQLGAVMAAETEIAEAEKTRLLEMMGANDAAVKQLAARALAARGDKRVVAPLLDWLEHGTDVEKNYARKLLKELAEINNLELDPQPPAPADGPKADEKPGQAEAPAADVGDDTAAIGKLRVKLAELQAQHEAARARYALLETEFKRAIELAEVDAIKKADVEKQSIELEKAAQEVDVITVSIKDHQVKLQAMEAAAEERKLQEQIRTLKGYKELRSESEPVRIDVRTSGRLVRVIDLGTEYSGRVRSIPGGYAGSTIPSPYYLDQSQIQPQLVVESSSNVTEFISTGDTPALSDQDLIRRWKELLAQDVKLQPSSKLIPFPTFERGHTFISYFGDNRVVELDAAGQVIWEHKVNAPWSCELLEDGHRLVASSSRVIAEFDENGKVVWEVKELPGRPVDVDRLPSGNTLVICNGEHCLVEYDAKGELVRRKSLSDRPFAAEVLENGNLLITLADSGWIYEYTPDLEQIVWQFRATQGACGAWRMSNGQTLVADTNANRLLLVNKEGNIAHAHTGIANPYSAQPLSNGNILVAAMQGVFEIDGGGNKVWQYKGSQGEGAASDVHRN